MPKPTVDFHYRTLILVNVKTWFAKPLPIVLENERKRLEIHIMWCFKAHLHWASVSTQHSWWLSTSVLELQPIREDSPNVLRNLKVINQSGITSDIADT